MIKYYILNQEVPTPKKLGRPPKCTPEVMLKIEQLTTKDGLMSYEKFGRKLKLAASTVFMKRRELKFQYKPPKIRQTLTDEQIIKRLLFANSVLNEKIDQKLIVFSDESRFALKNDNGHIWYRRSENSDDVYQDKDKYQTTIMVFGAIGYQYKSKLILCLKNEDEIEYRDVFTKSGICETLNEQYGEPGKFIFMQDGATSHTSANSKLFLQKRCSFLSFWPPNSPDLNPIEHLWGAIKKIIQNHVFNNRSELFDFISKIWDEFLQNKIDELCLSFNINYRCFKKFN